VDAPYGTLRWALDGFASFSFLSVLWLAACVPVVTIFPATAAMFGVTREWAKGRRPETFRFFVSSFKAHFRQSLWIGLVWTVLGIAVALNLYWIGNMSGAPRLLSYAATLLVGLAYALTTIYLFPTMVSYEIGWLKVLRNSLLLAIGQPGKTLLCLSILISTALVFVVLPVTLLLTASLSAYLVCLLHERALKRATSFDPGDHQGA
jgi:uncharacterized membrane protein YesL